MGLASPDVQPARVVPTRPNAGQPRSNFYQPNWSGRQDYRGRPRLNDLRCGGIMNFVSPFPDVVIPDTSVYEYVFGGLSRADGDRVALVETATQTEVSYRALVTRIECFASALAQRGIGVGDVVGLLSPNSAAFAAALHGILRAGATATPINILSTVDEIARQLRDSGARLLISATRFRTQAEEAATAVGLSSGDVLLLDINDHVSSTGSGGPEV